jgi:hypothetical protein
MQRSHRDALANLETLFMRRGLCDKLAVFSSNYGEFAELFQLV